MNIKTPDEVHIGCFGAIRILKGHINQALAAIKVADYNKLKLYFHINGTRVEGEGEGPLKNLEAIFKNSKHVLVKEPWLSHKDFLKLMKTMDILCQVSFTETHNIVACDAVASKVPVVASNQISWLKNNLTMTPSPNDLISIYFVINQILYLDKHKYEKLLKQQEKCLKAYNDKSEEIWLNWIFKNQVESY